MSAPSPYSAQSPELGSGLWACDLASEELRWSEGVYALFGIERAAPLDRRRIVDLYDKESRIALECLRLAAIRDKSGFMLDARICPPGARERWIRISARVETVDGKASMLSGVKHDVTLEHQWRGADAPPPAILFSR